MKSDRPHHVQINQTEEDTSDLADWFKQYWPRIALGVVLVALICILIYQRIDASRQRSSAAGANLAMARYNIQQLEAFNPMRAADQEQAATLREQFADTARDALSAAQKNSSKDAILAEAAVAQGDLNWTLANLPPLPGAATRPALRPPQSESDYLNQAAEAYESVLKKYPKESLAVVSAHFGLAAIAENKGDWEAAHKQYAQVTELKGIPRAFIDQANARINDLDELKQPVVLGHPATLPTTQAAAQPAATQPAVASTKPAKRATSAMPSTKPSTRPENQDGVHNADLRIHLQGLQQEF
jgi:hypothetical protein